MREPQKFAYSEAKTLRTSSGIFFGMAQTDDLNAILAKNLDYMMKRPGSLYPNANSLSVAAGIAANTVRNYLDPTRRTVTSDKPEGFPTLDKLQALASKLNCAVWELLHPDIERSLREREMYRKVEADFDRIQNEAKSAADAKPVSRLRTS
jgi:hypothetical protein